MRSKRLLQPGIIAAALAVALMGAGAGSARASQITLDVSGSMTNPFNPGPSYALGGSLVIDNSTSQVISADVTLSGVGTFDYIPNPGPFNAGSGLTKVIVDTPGVTAVLDLDFSTPTPGSLVGYTGGPLSTQTSASETSNDNNNTWLLASGSLTEAQPANAAEPGALTLSLLAVGALALYEYRKRRLAAL